MDLELDIIWQITTDYSIIWVYMYILQNNIIDLIWSKNTTWPLAPLKDAHAVTSLDFMPILLPILLASSMSPKRISSGGSSGRSSAHNDISDTTDTSRHPDIPQEIEGKLLEALVLVVVVMALKLPEVGDQKFIGKKMKEWNGKTYKSDGLGIIWWSSPEW